MTSHVAVHSICMYIINHPGLGAFVSIIHINPVGHLFMWWSGACGIKPWAGTGIRKVKESRDKLRARVPACPGTRSRTRHVWVSLGSCRHLCGDDILSGFAAYTLLRSSDKHKQSFSELWAEATCCLVFGPCRIVGYCSGILMNVRPLWDVREDQVRLITPHSQGKQPNALWC